MEKLRKDYFPNITNVGEIINGNIGLLSDSFLDYAVLKSTALQANLNNRDKDKNIGRAFLFRSLKLTKIFRIRFHNVIAINISFIIF